MPNWCYNYLEINGSKSDISDIKKQLNEPFTRMHDQWNRETAEMESKEFEYSNPIIAFWNIIKPLNLEAYEEQPVRSEKSVNDPDWWADTQRLAETDNSWYNWNHRNWGTKWDIAVHNEDKYPETELYEETDTSLAYKFNTAWSPPIPAIEKLSEQYPECEITLSFEEETGWGGEYVFENGNGSEIESYDNKCRDCDSLNTLEYCENDCGEICSSCHYLGEADMDHVAECEEHKQYA
jgi:hypothetical protein